MPATELAYVEIGDNDRGAFIVGKHIVELHAISDSSMEELLKPNKLCEMVKCSQSNGLNGIGTVCECCEHNHRNLGLCLTIRN